MFRTQRSRTQFSRINLQASTNSAEQTYEATKTAHIPATSPNGHLPKEDAQSRCGRCAALHPPQVQNQGEVDERGDEGPRGVQSQTVVDLPPTQQSGDQTEDDFTRC